MANATSMAVSFDVAEQEDVFIARFSREQQADLDVLEDEETCNGLSLVIGKDSDPLSGYTPSAPQEHTLKNWTLTWMISRHQTGAERLHLRLRHNKKTCPTYMSTDASSNGALVLNVANGMPEKTYP